MFLEEESITEVTPQLEGRLTCLHGYTLEELIAFMSDPALAPAAVRAALPYVRQSIREIASRRRELAHRVAARRRALGA